MRLTVIGCAGSFPGPDSPASCYLVQADDGDGRTWSVLLDLGAGALGPLQEYIDPFDLDAIALTHLHPDHVADMSALYVYRRYHPERAGALVPVPVYGPFGTAGRLEEAYGLDPNESMQAEFDINVWQPGSPVQIGPLSISPIAVHHPVPAYGMRITGPSEADPKVHVTMGYTGDTDSCLGLGELADRVDLLLSEAAFVEGRDETRGVHLTGLRAGEAAAAAEVGQLVLTHIPSWNDPEIAKVEAATAYPGPIVVAGPGMVFDL